MFTFKSSFVLAALALSALAIPAPNPGTQPFTLQNGKDAIGLNDKFVSLGANSPCTSGQDACIQGMFAQCVGGTFVTTQCSAGTQCAALPLVNKAGTSITCTTEADKNARIAATGATGSESGNAGNANAAAAAPSPAAAAASPAAASPAASAPAGGAAPGAKPFTLANGKAAQALNDQFAGLTPDSSCTAGQNACVAGKFAQCVGGKFVLTACAGGLHCAALPLVNSPGTSVTCVDQAQESQRIANTGA